METPGRSYKNPFGCVEMPERQTGSRQTDTHAARKETKRRGRRMHGPNIKKYKRTDRRGGQKRDKKKERGKDTRGHELRQTATHT